MSCLSDSERSILKTYFELDPNWKRKTVKAAATELGFSYRKVYKWGYDQKIKYIRDCWNANTTCKVKISSKLCLSDTKFFDDWFGALKKDYNKWVDALLRLCDNQIPDSSADATQTQSTIAYSNWKEEATASSLNFDNFLSNQFDSKWFEDSQAQECYEFNNEEFNMDIFSEPQSNCFSLFDDIKQRLEVNEEDIF